MALAVLAELPALPLHEAGKYVAGAYVVLVEGEASLYLDRGGRGLMALRSLDGISAESA